MFGAKGHLTDLTNKDAGAVQKELALRYDENMQQAKEREAFLSASLDKAHADTKKLKSNVIALLKSEKELKDSVSVLETALEAAQNTLTETEFELDRQTKLAVEVPTLLKNLAESKENEQSLKYALIRRGA